MLYRFIVHVNHLSIVVDAPNRERAIYLATLPLGTGLGFVTASILDEPAGESERVVERRPG